MAFDSDKLSGKLNQGVGSVTGDDKLKHEGKLQEVAGKAKETVQDAGRKLTDKVDELVDKHGK